MIIDEDIYLEHFGVRGMRWGVQKNSKPSAETKARREEKAKKYEDKIFKLQTKIDKTDASLIKSPYSPRLIEQKQKLQKQQVQALKDAEAKRQGKFTDKERKIVKGSAIAAGILIAYGSYQIAQSGELTRLSTKGKDFIHGNKPGWKSNRALADPNLSVDQIHNNVVKPINPHYGAPGTKTNCRRATFAYEMRRRGYDVNATHTTSGKGQNLVGNYNALHPGAKVPNGPFGIMRAKASEALAVKRGKEVKLPISDILRQNQLGDKALNPTSIFHDLGKLPNGSRGELGMLWGNGGGHSMAWENVGGKPVIFDTQTGAVYKTQAAFKDVASSMQDVGYTRLDNAPLNTDFLLRWVKDA